MCNCALNNCSADMPGQARAGLESHFTQGLRDRDRDKWRLGQAGRPGTVQTSEAPHCLQSGQRGLRLRSQPIFDTAKRWIKPALRSHRNVDLVRKLHSTPRGVFCKL